MTAYIGSDYIGGYRIDVWDRFGIRVETAYFAHYSEALCLAARNGWTVTS